MFKDSQDCHLNARTCADAKLPLRSMDPGAALCCLWFASALLFKNQLQLLATLEKKTDVLFKTFPHCECMVVVENFC